MYKFVQFSTAEFADVVVLAVVSRYLNLKSRSNGSLQESKRRCDNHQEGGTPLDLDETESEFWRLTLYIQGGPS